MQANPDGIQALIDDINLGRRKLAIGGVFYKKLEVPAMIPTRLRQMYCAKELYISKINPVYENAFSEKIINEVRKDFTALAPVYRLLRGYTDEILQTGKE